MKKYANLEKNLPGIWRNLPGGMEITLPAGVYGLKRSVTLVKNKTPLERLCEERNALWNYWFQTEAAKGMKANSD